MNTTEKTYSAVYAPYAERFTLEQFADYDLATRQTWRRWLGIAAITAVVGAFVSMSVSISSAAYLIIAGLVLGGAYQLAYAVPRNNLQRYTEAFQLWQHVTNRTNPLLSLDMPVPPRDGEDVIYREHSVRHEERNVGAVIQPVNAIGRGIVGDVLLGPAGAFIGAASASSHVTQQYNTVPVDAGELVVTNKRVMFLGERNTLHIEADEVLRWAAVPGTKRIIIDYVRRCPGESYEVHPLIFPMAMAKRGHNSAFQLPLPPPPLPLDVVA